MAGSFAVASDGGRRRHDCRVKQTITGTLSPRDVNRCDCQSKKRRSLSSAVGSFRFSLDLPRRGGSIPAGHTSTIRRKASSLHRGKTAVRVFDCVDGQIPVLARMLRGDKVSDASEDRSIPSSKVSRRYNLPIFGQSGCVHPDETKDVTGILHTQQESKWSATD
jgi:hypothetical protein